MRNEVTLYTSIPPRLARMAQGREIGPTYQAKCVQSWKDAGFEIVSLNAEVEIAALRQSHPGVDFVSGPNGRPHIVDLLQYIGSSGRPVAGIVNADVVFLKGPDVASNIVASAHHGLVMLERINISPDTMAPTHQSCYGFDAFLFDTRYLSTLAMDRHLKIGETWWDYCFPLAFHRAGGQLRRSPSPLLLHLDHPQGWDDAQYVANGRRTHAAFSALVQSAPARLIDREPNATDIADFSLATFGWLRNEACAVDYTGTKSAAA